MTRLGKTLWIALTVALTAGCATLPDRVPVASDLQSKAGVPQFDNVRLHVDAPVETLDRWRDEMLADRARSGIAKPLDLLALSSGSDEGAFGAGYLVGWSESGARPDFDIVVGVSTGALMAPFAFLGSDRDEVLTRLYTSVDADDIFRLRPVSGLLGGPAMASSRPLREMIEREVTPALVRDIAAEHNSGRRLLVLTTNLDTQRGVIWDVGAIASNKTREAEALIEQVLLASSSIPALLPPVLIEVSADGQSFTEMHVDGGTTASVLAVPQNLLFEEPGLRPEIQSGGAITIIYNGRVDPTVKLVQPRTFSILQRSLVTMITAVDRRMLNTYRAFADRNEMTFSVAAIEGDFDDTAFDDRGRFNRAYMQALFAYGRERGRSAR